MRQTTKSESARAAGGLPTQGGYLDGTDVDRHARDGRHAFCPLRDLSLRPFRGRGHGDHHQPAGQQGELPRTSGATRRDREGRRHPSPEKGRHDAGPEGWSGRDGPRVRAAFERLLHRQLDLADRYRHLAHRDGSISCGRSPKARGPIAPSWRSATPAGRPASSRSRCSTTAGSTSPPNPR